MIPVLVALLAATTAFAAPAKSPEAWSSGVIEKFDATAHSLVVKQGSHLMTFALASTVKVLDGKTTLTPDDLAKNAGHSVKVRYTVANGTKTADRVEVSSHTATASHPSKSHPAHP
jgi:phage baseplate assembly protein gpV